MLRKLSRYGKVAANLERRINAKFLRNGKLCVLSIRRDQQLVSSNWYMAALCYLQYPYPWNGGPLLCWLTGIGSVISYRENISKGWSSPLREAPERN